VTVPGLAGATVAASVVRDHTETLAQEKEHLRIPVIGREWPAMAENDGLSGTPILVINFGTVFHFDNRHFEIPLVTSQTRPGKRSGFSWHLRDQYWSSSEK
jgi:hypothetical protein